MQTIDDIIDNAAVAALFMPVQDDDLVPYDRLLVALDDGYIPAGYKVWREWRGLGVDFLVQRLRLERMLARITVQRAIAVYARDIELDF